MHTHTVHWLPIHQGGKARMATRLIAVAMLGVITPAVGLCAESPKSEVESLALHEKAVDALKPFLTVSVPEQAPGKREAVEPQYDFIVGLDPEVADDEAAIPLADFQDRLKLLKHLRNLVGVTIQDDRLATDSSLEQIAQCKQVESVRLAGSQFTEEGIARLASLPGLVVLEISYPCKEVEYLKKRLYEDAETPTLSGAGVLSILRAHQLECLWLRGVSVGAEVVAELPKQRDLSYAKLPSKNLSVKDLRAIASNGSLKILMLDGHLGSTEGIAGLTTSFLAMVFPGYEVTHFDLFDTGYNVVHPSVLEEGD